MRRRPLRTVPWTRVAMSEAAAIVRSGLAVIAPSALPEPQADPTLRPVVLVHGYLGRPAMLRPLAAALLDAGVPEVAFARYDSLTATLDDVVAAIARAVVPLALRHGPIDLVGHSLGAFASRVWLKRDGGAPHVHHFVSIGGPHAGTALHWLVPSPVGRAMDPDGELLLQLAAAKEPVPTTVIRASWDQQVFPPVRARIPGVTEVVLEGLGHNGLLFDPAAHTAVQQTLLRAAQRDEVAQRDASMPSDPAAG